MNDDHFQIWKKKIWLENYINKVYTAENMVTLKNNFKALKENWPITNCKKE